MVRSNSWKEQQHGTRDDACHGVVAG